LPAAVAVSETVAVELPVSKPWVVSVPFKTTSPTVPVIVEGGKWRNTREVYGGRFGKQTDSPAVSWRLLNVSSPLAVNS
jgi:hypothetical protein